MTKHISHTLTLLASLACFNLWANTDNASQQDSLSDSTVVTQLSIKNAVKLNAQMLTGGQPSIKDLEMMADNGYKHIVNLRDSEEFTDFDEQKVAENLGLTYTSIPIAGASGLTLDNLAKFNRVLFDLQLNTSEKTLVHCASGNRVGAFFALNAYFVQGETLEQSLITGKAAGLSSLEPVVITFINENSHARKP